MAHGDYAKWNGFYTPKNISVPLPAGTTAVANAISPRSANHQLFIQKISLSISTHAAESVTFDDDGSGPVVAAQLDVTPQAAGVPSSIVWDFGPQGYGLTVGANLDITKGTTIVAVAHIEAYEKLATPVAYTSA